MKIRSILSTALNVALTAAAIALLPIAASAATFVVPAAGTGAGANNSQWQSELTLHSTAQRAITVSITFHQGTNVFGPVSVPLAARETKSIADIAKTLFGVPSGTGALVIDASEVDARHLALTSRTFNTTKDGEFGQDIPALRATDGIGIGDTAAITAPSSIATTRFNFGIYATAASNVTWELLRANGTVAASLQKTHAAGEHAQYNNGVNALFGVEPQNNDTVHGRVTSGNAMFYGSAINATGDPTFVPSVRTREDIVITFGVDEDENGSVDFSDANGDGVLDQTLEIFTGAFPNYFRVVVESEAGEAVKLELVSSTSDSVFIDSKGTLLTSAYAGLKGQKGSIVVRATVNGIPTLLTIPVSYR